MRHLLKFLAVALIARPAFGWGPEGHMTIAAFAYDDMVTKHPAELAKILSALRQHPEAAKFEKRLESIAPENRDRYLMMVAARWPDDVRSPKSEADLYHHGPWHYVDFPVVPPGEHVTPPAMDAENALTAIKGQADVIRSAKSPGDSAVALCWIEHLVGDLHQPLHATSLYCAKFPEGDRGGNLIFIRVPPDGEGTINLHQFWDGTLGTSWDYKDAANQATALLHRPDLARDRLQNVQDGKPDDWAKESYDIAVKYAYLNGALQGGTKKEGQLLPPDYAKTAKGISEIRAAQAGYRLEDSLVELSKSLPPAK